MGRETLKKYLNSRVQCCAHIKRKCLKHIYNENNRIEIESAAAAAAFDTRALPKKNVTKNKNFLAINRSTTTATIKIIIIVKTMLRCTFS